MRALRSWFHGTEGAGRDARWGESGFSIIEAVVSLGVISAVIMMMSGGLASSMHAALATKVQQKATALGNEQIEAARALTYAALALRSGDLTGDPRITSPAGVPAFDPDGSGPLLPEPIAVDDANGTIYPHIGGVQVGETSYTVGRYVTWVDANIQGGIQRDHKRFVAIVTWPVGGSIRTFHTSTLISDVGRGRPVETFEVDPVKRVVQIPFNGSSPQEVASSHAITNLEVPGSFGLSLAGLPGGWEFLRYESDSLDWSSTGSETDTQVVGTSQTLNLNVVVRVPAGEPVGTTILTLTVDPSSASGPAIEVMLEVTIGA